MTQRFSLNLRGRLVEYDRPAVMDILNVTPDSFYSGSRAQTCADISAAAKGLVANGADMIDIGAYSSRSGADDVPAAEELRRIEQGIKAVREAVGHDIPLSVDTFRAEVARKAIEWGADIINDISGGSADPAMAETVASLHVPYILMHMRGTPATMQSMTEYNDVVADVIAEMSHQLYSLEEAGVADIIIDPGFGFAKTLDQNYRLLAHLDDFKILGRPILAGMSRKSMLTKLLGIEAADALAATAIVGALAIERGAAILRVHDPLEAAQAISIVARLSQNT